MLLVMISGRTHVDARLVQAISIARGQNLELILMRRVDHVLKVEAGSAARMSAAENNGTVIKNSPIPPF